jgi:hypothetical protein
MVDDKAEDLHCSDIKELLILHYQLGHTPFAKNHADSSGIFKAETLTVVPLVVSSKYFVALEF